ncbi:hypothetical protein V2J09_001041 [Rumex salicifolius]
MAVLSDPSTEIVPESGQMAVSCSPEKSIPCQEQLKEHRDSLGISDYSDDARSSSVDEVPRLPILKKIDVLEDKVRTLRKEQRVLSNQVKDFNANTFPGSEALTALQQISADHELLKKQHNEERELMKKKYLEECAERKRLYNEVIELKGNIRVFCRCRPLNQDEIMSGSSSIVEFDPSQDNELQITGADSSKKQFKFDHVFQPDDNQEAVFAETSPIVTSVLDGYNVCIFAYGQTGTGKTFTMEGTPESRGVNYRTLEELFRISEKRSSKMRYELSVSMLEVYNEKIRDLLAEKSSQPAPKLEIKQSADGTQEVPGLVEAQVYSTDEVWELLKTGNRASLLRVTVKGEDTVTGFRTRSNLWLVDLAGSERLAKIEAEGERLKESQFINKSLSALGDVIAALASKAAHVPYRNSKLTHILQSSLGGDCKTLMFVQISPCNSDLGETLCSLNFASRVKGIEYGPARKHVDHAELLKYKQLAEKAKHDEKEMKKLQDSVQSLQLRLSAKDHVCKSLQDKIRDLENLLTEERRLRLKQDNSNVASSAATNRNKHSSLLPPKVTQKPPLGSFKMRMPLRPVNSLQPPKPYNNQQKSTATHFSTFSNSTPYKENACSGASRTAKPLLQARRASVAVRPTTTTNSQSSNTKGQTTLMPKRRVSIAVLRPETNSYMETPRHGSSKLESARKRQSLFRDPVRAKRYSKLFDSSSQAVEATPMSVNRTSSRFMGSPPGQMGSWKPKHPTVVALQKKAVLWSPLRLKASLRQRQSSIFP